MGERLSACNSVSLGVKRELIWIKSVWLIRDHNYFGMIGDENVERTWIRAS
jgi:hypothetical protein